MPGVLFEGGSFRPIFSCGVMDALLDEDILFPYCIGVSAGAADAISYISKQRGRNMEVFVKYRNDPRYLSKRNLVRSKSPFGLDFVFGKVPNRLVPFDMETFQSYTGKFLIGTTDAVTGESHYFTQKDVDHDYQVLRATCALPTIFPAIEVQGKKYYDGGVADPIPIDKALMDGNDKMLIVLTRPAGYVKQCHMSDRMAAKMISHKYPKIANGIRTRYQRYNAAVTVCENLEKEGKAVILRPSKPIDSFEKDVETLKNTYRMGYHMCQEKMDDIRKLFTEMK